MEATSSRSTFKTAVTIAAMALAMAMTSCATDPADPTSTTQVNGETSSTSSSPSTSAPGTTQPDEGANEAPVVIWADATRSAQVEAYLAEFPEQDITLETVAFRDIPAKIQLLNRSGSGWPDLIFSGPDEIAMYTSEQFDNFAADIGDLVDPALVEGYGDGNSLCLTDGQTLCLRNDLAQTVLWYDTVLLDEFGYSVPTTMAEFQEVGSQLAEEHPGYYMGALGEGANWFGIHFWSSGCPMTDVIDEGAVHIDTTDTRCTRVVETYDPMLENGSMSNLSRFDPAFIDAAKAGQLLMIIQPSWFSEHVLKPTYEIPAGRIAAAPTPVWDGETSSLSGSGGGGAWVVSRHSENVERAVEVASWLVSSEASITLAPTYPAYEAIVDFWAEQLDLSYYAEDPIPLLKDAVAQINPVNKPIRFRAIDSVDDTVGESVRSGGDAASALEGLQSALVNQATVAGYAVVEEGS